MSHGISSSQLTRYENLDRVFTATMTTPAIFVPGVNQTRTTVPVHVNVYLPNDYDPNRAKPYEVLYLPHGGTGSDTQWASPADGSISTVLRDFEQIVVMPEGGYAGWYANWYGETNGHFKPAWETFHIDQLVPWVDDNFNTEATRAGRAIAGLSTGGYGALRHGSRRNDLFSAVGAFSGGTDVREDGARLIIAEGAAYAGARIGDQWDVSWWVSQSFDERLRRILGPPADYASFNPIQRTSSSAAYGGKLAIYAGGDDGTGETDIAAWNKAFHDRLAAAPAVPHRYCHGAGRHSMNPYWRGDLVNFVGFVHHGGPETGQVCPNGWPAPN